MKKELSEVLLDSFADKALSFSDCLDLTSQSNPSSDIDECNYEETLSYQMLKNNINEQVEGGLPSQNYFCGHN
jgi:hypothetical protein